LTRFIQNFAERFDINVKQVIIHKLVDGVFYSASFERDKIEEIIDARTSDAIALAFDLMLLSTRTNILDKAGIYLKNSKQIRFTRNR
jgi:bifunctional DNase/RNase